MKKSLTVLLSLALMCGILSACGGRPNGTSSSDSSSTGIYSSDAGVSGSGGATDSITDISAISVEEAAVRAAQIQYGKDVIVVRFGNAGALGETGPTACQYYCDLANIAFNGKYRFDFYPSEQLGNEITMLENMQMGLQEVMMTTLSTMATY